MLNGKKLKSLFSFLLVFIMTFSMVGQVFAKENNKIKVKVRVEGPEYTILPETEVEIDNKAENTEALKAAGLNVKNVGMIDEIEGIKAKGWWAIEPYKTNLSDGDSILFNGNGAMASRTSLELLSTTDEGKTLEVVYKEKDGKPINNGTIKYYKADEYNYKGINKNKIKPIDTKVTTDKDGKGKVTLEPGKYFLVAEAEGKARTKGLEVEVKNHEDKYIEKFKVERVGQDKLKRDCSEEIKFNIKNNDMQDRNVTLAVVLYNKDTKQMQKYAYVKKILKSQEKETLAVGFIIPKEGQYEVKAIICDDLDIKKMNMLNKPVNISIE